MRGSTSSSCSKGSNFGTVQGFKVQAFKVRTNFRRSMDQQSVDHRHLIIRTDFSIKPIPSVRVLSETCLPRE